MKKAIITFLLLCILGAIGCVMHPKYFFFIGTIQNNSSKKLYVLLSCDTTIESESQIERSRAYFINKNESQEIRVPNHPDFPPEHKWYINYYEAVKDCHPDYQSGFAGSREVPSGDQQNIHDYSGGGNYACAENPYG